MCGIKGRFLALATGGLLKLRFRRPLSLAFAWITPEVAAAAATAKTLSARDEI